MMQKSMMKTSATVEKKGVLSHYFSNNRDFTSSETRISQGHVKPTNRGRKTTALLSTFIPRNPSLRCLVGALTGFDG